MPATALKLESYPINIRRFQLPDLAQHGGWIMKRLIDRYPHQTERAMAGWLTGLISSNECLFLYQEHAVALAQLVNTYSLELKPVVQERFVFAEDASNELHIDMASNFYDEFSRWTKSMSIDKLIVEEMSDVPHEKIKERLGRLFTTQLTFARV
jgi:hypothetical protein